MAYEQKNPAACGDRAPNVFRCLVALNGSENTTPAESQQGHRDEMGDIMRRQFIAECAFELKQRAVLMTDALVDGEDDLAREYWSICRLVGREISRTLDEVGAA